MLRVDATTCRGITAAIAAMHVAASCDRMVIPHVWIWPHAHLVVAMPHLAAVEMIPSDSLADPVDRLLADAPSPKEAWWALDATTGHGSRIDWSAVERHASAAIEIVQGPAAPCAKLHGVAGTTSVAHT